MTGVHSSSSPTRVRISRVLPWPRSPSSTMSWPASSARSSSGTTVSSNPTIPGNGSTPARSRIRRLSRTSSLTDRCTCPAARSAPRVRGRSAGGVGDGDGFSAHRTNVRRAARTCDHGVLDGQVARGGKVRCGDGLAVGADVVPGRRAGVHGGAACRWATPTRTWPASSSAASRATTPRPRSSTPTGSCRPRRPSAAPVTAYSAPARGVEQLPAVSVWAATMPGVKTAGLPPRGAAQRRVALGRRDAAGRRRHARCAAGRHLDLPGRRLRHQEQRDPGRPAARGWARRRARPAPARTRLLIDDRVVDRGAVGVLLSGASVARTVVSQGCRPIGPPMTVTASEGNVLLTLAGRPALEKLQEVVAALPTEDRSSRSPGLQIGIAMDEYAEEHGYGDFLVRGVVGRRRGARRRRGRRPRRGRPHRAVPAARRASAAAADLAMTLKSFRDSGGIEPAGALLFSCNGRGGRCSRTRPTTCSPVRGGPGHPAGGRLLRCRRDRAGRRPQPRARALGRDARRR